MHEDIHLYPQSAEAAPLTVTMAGESFCDGTYRIQRKQKAIYVIEYVIEGEGTYEVNGRTFHPRQGDVYVVQAHTSHWYGSSAKRPWRKIWMNCCGGVFGGLLQAYRLEGGFHFPGCDIQEPLRQTINQMNAHPMQAHTIGAVGLHRCFQAIHAQRPQQGETTLGPLASQAREWIEAHLHEPFGLDAMGDALGRSVSQVVRAFKAGFDQTPYQYALERKYRRAEQLLRETQMSIGDIASRVGFDDAYYFSTWFKKRSGQAPREFRRDARDG